MFSFFRLQEIHTKMVKQKSQPQINLNFPHQNNSLGDRDCSACHFNNCTNSQPQQSFTAFKAQDSANRQRQKTARNQSLDWDIGQENHPPHTTQSSPRPESNRCKKRSSCHRPQSTRDRNATRRMNQQSYVRPAVPHAPSQFQNGHTADHAARTSNYAQPEQSCASVSPPTEPAYDHYSGLQERNYHSL